MTFDEETIPGQPVSKSFKEISFIDVGNKMVEKLQKVNGRRSDRCLRFGEVSRWSSTLEVGVDAEETRMKK